MSIDITLNPGYDGWGYTDVQAIYHDSRELSIVHTVVLK